MFYHYDEGKSSDFEREILRLRFASLRMTVVVIKTATATENGLTPLEKLQSLL